MSSLSFALALPLAALLLAGCQRNEPPPAPTVIVAPGPTGEPGPAGATGATGDTGKPGEAAVVVVVPPASAASN